MSWTVLAPVARTTGSPRATAWIRATKRGLKLQVLISQMLHDELGQPDRCDVMAGFADTAGQLRLVFTATGAFELINSFRGCRRLDAPHFHGLPEVTARSLPCRVISQSKDELVLGLPVEGWEAEVSPRRVTRPAATAPAPPAPPPSVVGKVDLVEELGRFGFTVERRPADRYSIDGETHPKSRALSRLNICRNRAGAPSLTADEIL